MMTFSESILFSAIMVLLEQLEEGKYVPTNDVNYIDIDEYSIPTFTPSAYDYKKKLCDIAQGLIDEADAACGTESDASAEDLIPSMICGIIFETVNSLSIANKSKKEIYVSAAQYCGVEDAFPEDFLFNEVRTELSQSLMMLTDMGFEMILTASQEAENNEAGIGFIKIFSEFMLYLEKYLSEDYPYTSLVKRPSVLAVEKAIQTIKNRMQQMEEDNPALKQSEPFISSSSDTNRISNLLNTARDERKMGRMKQAEAYYKKALEIQPDNWEACFFSVFCAVHRTADNTNPSAIQNYTEDIINCTYRAMRLAKAQLYSRAEIIENLGEVAVGIAEIASNYFVAALNRFKSLNRSSLANNAKNAQVNAIIQMLFAVGDSIELNFKDDPEICAYTAGNCWKIAFDCYESCNMPAPEGLSEHYYKIRKYIPDFQSEKPLSGGTTQTSGRSEGCYIATAVYGSYDCPPVWTLRRFRDYFLANRWYGRLFIHVYYAVSPKLVKAFKRTKWFAKMCKYPLDKLVAHLMQKGYDNTAYTDGTALCKQDDK